MFLEVTPGPRVEELSTVSSGVGVREADRDSTLLEREGRVVGSDKLPRVPDTEIGILSRYS